MTHPRVGAWHSSWPTAAYADPGLAALRAPTAARLRGRRAFEVIVESPVTEASAAATAAIVDLS